MKKLLGIGKKVENEMNKETFFEEHFFFIWVNGKLMMGSKTETEAGNR